ncbi:hypothetical protein ACQPZF_36055 [Actinosynnema sp. CS-041913]|uniref:hypothetical protein n=1 Tax=Actinosynnema sp. CS-041913 TaxID=3239917 RepID=UPI003D8F59F5
MICIVQMGLLFTVVPGAGRSISGSGSDLALEVKMDACRSLRRWVSVATAAFVVAGLQVVTAGPAVALPATTVRTGFSEGGHSPGLTKWAEALCPAGQVVVGGGGEVLGEPQRTTVLTAVEPHTPEGPKPYRFVVQARALAWKLNGPNEDWQLKAYALCVPAASMPGYRIESYVSLPTTDRFMAHRAVCRNGLVAYSAGATTSDTTAFGLQLVRTSESLDITRATARAFFTPVTKEWSLTAIAVCGPRKDGIVAAGQVGPGPLVGVSCPAGTTQQIHGAGGGLGLTDDGGTNWIRELRPGQEASAPSSTRVRMSLQGPPGEAVAHTTCATKTP